MSGEESTTVDLKDTEIGLLKLALARDAETIRILQDQVIQQVAAEPDLVLLETIGLLTLLARGLTVPNLAIQASNLLNKLAERPELKDWPGFRA